MADAESGGSPLIDHIYDAALEPERWPDFLSALAAEFPAGQGVLYGMEGSRASVHLANWDPLWTRAHNLHFHGTNPWLAGMRTRPVGVANAAESFVPAQVFERGEYYNDFLRPQGLGTGVGATILRDGDTMVGVSVLFGKRGGETATRDDVAVLARLVPHLHRAARINRLVGEVRFKHAAAEQVLGRLNTGLLVVDEAGRSLFVNARAETILAARDGLLPGTGGRIEARDPGQTARLRHLVANAVRPPGSDRAASGGALSIPRSKAANLLLLVTPLRVLPDLLGFRDAAALIFIVDPTQRAPVQEHVVSALLGLTPMQGRIATALSQGLSVRDIAAGAGIAETTVRFHLKAIFARTETHGQSDLVRLVLTVAGGGRV